MAFVTSRQVFATPEQVLAAFQPERLARWWGPAGFTNTFETCDFKSGGKWKFVMHGPDGRDYENESEFVEVTPSKIVIQHISLPRYLMTISLERTPGGTLVGWHQDFEKPEVAKAIAHIVEPANEQNLDRLEAELARR